MAIVLSIRALQVRKISKIAKGGASQGDGKRLGSGDGKRLGSGEDVADTVPLDSESQARGDEANTSRPLSETDENQQEHAPQEGEQGEEEQLTDDELVIPVVSHEATKYDDMEEEVVSPGPTSIPDESQAEPMIAAAVEPVSDSQVPESPGAEVIASGDEQHMDQKDETSKVKQTGEDKGTFKDRQQKTFDTKAVSRVFDAYWGCIVLYSSFDFENLYRKCIDTFIIKLDW